MIQTLKDWNQVWTVERPDHYRGYPVRNTAWVCPVCLRMWALFQREGVPRHAILAAPCVDCPDGAHEILRPVPGSLINDWTGTGGFDEDLLDALPLELVKIEFSLTLEAWEQIWLPKTRASSQASTCSSRGLQEQERLPLSEPSRTLD